MPRLTERLKALERTGYAHASRPLPVVLPDTATDAELEALRRSGRQAYRENDPALFDLFI